MSINKNNQYKKELIANKLGAEEILTAIAEEASELTQAVLKLRRAYNKLNYTPKTEADCIQNVTEEMADLEVSIEILRLCISTDVLRFMDDYKTDIKERKLERWFDRLGNNEK